MPPQPKTPRPPTPAQQEAERRRLERIQRERNRRYRRAPGQAARAVTVRKGGQHALMAEFLLFLGIVAMRAIADYVPGNQGQPDEGTAKGEVKARSGQLGPLPVLAAGFTVFFVLSFLAARGGTWARIAAVSGLIIDTALLMKSLPELNTVSQGFTNATAASQAAQASTYVQPVGYQGTATVPVPVQDATGLFPVITPNLPPAAEGAGQNPAVFTQP